MALLGTLLKNRRGRDAHSAWNRPNLHAPDELILTSNDVEDGARIPRAHAGRRVGGQNLSPHLAWTPPPAGTTELLLVVEDLDVPLATPAVHCLAIIDLARLDIPHQLPPRALSAKEPAPGVRILRSTVRRGYHGPEPIKGHGPHRYTFQLFAFDAPATGSSGADSAVAGDLARARPRAVLDALTVRVVARGRLTSTYER